MKLFYVRMHNEQPGIILYDYTRAKAGRRAKRMFGADKIDEIIPISKQDAEAEFGDNYMQQARWNLLRSEDMEEVSVLTGDNPFLEEKMNMKKADMGDVIDDFKSSDAPQFKGKSMAKRRQMAIAAKLQANEEEKEHYKLSTVTEGIDQKVLTQFKTMMKDGEEDSVRLLLQGMPKHTKKMYMSRLGLKESDKIDGRTKAFRETISRLNMAKVKPVEEEEIEEDISKLSSSRLKYHAVKGMQHGRFTNKEIDAEHKRRQKVEPNYHKVKPSINEDDLEERTPVKLMVKDKKLPNLKIPNPNHKRYGELTQMNNKSKKPKADIYRETKEAPAGTYFTRSGQLKKGDPASDGPGGEKLASDPLDKQRKTIVNLKNYPK